MSVEERSVGDLAQVIRDFINSPRKQNALIRDSAYWNMLCSSLDTIGDTELALDAYEQISEPTDPGALYLLVYGTLQALFLQQDAVTTLAESLQLDIEVDPLLNRIREIRNDAAGHPTKRGGGRGKSHSFISRATMRKSGFQLMTAYPDLTPTTFQSVDISKLIELQRRCLRKVLTNLAGELEREEREHMNQFKDQKLKDAFHPSLSYLLSKVCESTFGNAPPQLGLVNLEEAERMLQAFNDSLEERGLTGAYSGVAGTLEQLSYPLEQLKSYFKDPEASRLNDRDAYIFASFVIAQFEELQEMAGEIDAEYQGERSAP